MKLLIVAVIAWCSLTAVCAYSQNVASQNVISQKDPLEPYRENARATWEREIVKLEALDQQEKYPADAVLFIGSSSIRLWTDLAADMAPRSAINRGYGGAKFSDLACYVERLVRPHACQAIVIFVANDVTGGADDKSPEEVSRLFRYIVDTIRKSHPTQPIFLLAITPTPSRFKVWPEIRVVNTALQQVCASDPSLHFIATEHEYLDADGQPIAKYFGEDRLHQNRTGYLVWSRIVREHLDKVLTPATSSDR